jgi:predicted DNA-binding transcriptional regulator YafY
MFPPEAGEREGEPASALAHTLREQREPSFRASGGAALGRVRFARRGGCRGGTIELRLELGSLEEIERWILSWGAHARVLEPAELKRRIRRSAEAILAAT